MKKIIVVVVIASVFLSNVFASNNLSNFTEKNTYLEGQFADVSSYAWYMQNVVQAYELGLLGGVSASEFAPERNITDYETLALACRLHSIYYNTGVEFKQGSPWYQVYIDYAQSRAIPCKNLSGKAATREFFVTMVAVALPDAAFAEINEVLLIPDVVDEKVSYYDAVHKLYRAGVLTGSGEEGEFLPDTNIKRSEVAAIVTRIADTALRVNFRLPKKSEELALIEEICAKNDKALKTFELAYELVEHTVYTFDCSFLDDADDIFHTAAVQYKEIVAECEKNDFLTEVKPYFDYMLDFCEQFAYKETSYQQALNRYSDFKWDVGKADVEQPRTMVGVVSGVGEIGRLYQNLQKRLIELQEEETEMIKEKKNV